MKYIKKILVACNVISFKQFELILVHLLVFLISENTIIYNPRVGKKM